MCVWITSGRYICGGQLSRGPKRTCIKKFTVHVHAGGGGRVESYTTETR